MGPRAKKLLHGHRPHPNCTPHPALSFCLGNDTERESKHKQIIITSRKLMSVQGTAQRKVNQYIGRDEIGGGEKLSLEMKLQLH